MNRPSQLALMLSLALAVPLVALPMAASAHPMAQTSHEFTAAPSALAQTMRTLWLGHAEGVRSYLIAVHDKKPKQATAAADHVVANAKSIADAVGSFYGKPAGTQMLTLLAGHWGAVKAYIDASAANDETGRNTAIQTLNANAKDIADFLSGANPYLPQATLLSLLTTHGAHHIAQTQQVFAGDKQAEAATWKAMRAHMVMIGDALAGGIAKQFPDKVKG